MSICPEVIAKLQAAMNHRDVEALVKCFAAHYQSEQPFHPDRGFSGTEKLHRNWTLIFERVPDFKAEVMCSRGENDIVWSEWRWHGTGFEWRGVILFGVKDEIIEWARANMAAYKVPRYVAFIDALPRSGTGKIQWRALQEAENAAS